MIISDESFFHVTWQCHNKDWFLKWDWAKKYYYQLLLKYKDKYDVTIYSYSFMDNHPHLTGHLKYKDKFSDFFRVVNCQFAKAINKHLGRRGQVVMDRFKSPRIETDKHMLTVMAYIDLNPYRAGKVAHPRYNDWSSYGYYAHGRKDLLLTPSPSYLALGRTNIQRQSEYRRIVNSLIDNKDDINITNTSFIGNPDWVIRKYRELREVIRQKQVNKERSSTSPPS